MSLYELLQEIAAQVPAKKSSQESVDCVIALASIKYLVGERMAARPFRGDTIQKLNRGGEILTANWHAYVLFSEAGFESPEYVVDLDSPSRVYRLEDYKRECFLEPSNVRLQGMEEG